SGQLGEERLAVAPAAMARLDEKIFQVDTRLADKGGIIGEKQGEADDLAIVFRQQDLGIGLRTKKVLANLVYVENDLVGQPFVIGQSMNQAANGWYITGNSMANHSGIIEPAPRKASGAGCAGIAITSGFSLHFGVTVAKLTGCGDADSLRFPEASTMRTPNAPVTCPQCGRTFQAAEGLQGGLIFCPSCGRQVDIPVAGQQPVLQTVTGVTAQLQNPMTTGPVLMLIPEREGPGFWSLLWLCLRRAFSWNLHNIRITEGEKKQLEA